FIMTDEGLKSLLGFLLRNKDTAFTVLENFKPEDIEEGILAIPEKLINEDIKMLILDKAGPYLNDYGVLFLENAILLDLDINVKPLGRLKAKYMLSVNRFDFCGDTHRISLSYKEDVKSEGNFLQSMALKAVAMNRGYLQAAAEMMKLDFVEAGEDVVAIYLDKLELVKKIPPGLNVRYVSSLDGILKLKFYFA
ncbi:MAG TPA: hypothetical protein VN381_00245, partial [Anaerovoracaceae bacterium]|nr:hypothetical protein [Anaerovoracaceae bacterium]